MTLPEHGSASGGTGYPPTTPVFAGAGPTQGAPQAATHAAPHWEEPLDDEDLVGPEPARRLPWITGLLALAVVAAAAFWGGVLVQKHHDRKLVSTTSATSGTAGARIRGAAGAGGFGGFGGGGGGGGATVGQVKLVDGSTIYVTDTSGNTVTVKMTDSSKITKQTAAGLKDVAPGDTVIIRGASQSDGSISAATVTDNGASGTATTAGRSGAGSGGGGFGGGGFGGAGGTGAGGPGG